jgi:hypothetical protein
MGFLTSGGGLGQPWYDKSNTVGGLLSMQELTNKRNFQHAPTDNWPPTGAMFGMGNRATQGTYLSPSQAANVVPAQKLASQPQMFGMGAHGGKKRRRRRRKESSKAGLMSPQVETAIAVLGKGDALNDVAKAARRRGRAQDVFLAAVKSKHGPRSHQAIDTYFEYLTGKPAKYQASQCPPAHKAINAAGRVMCAPVASEKAISKAASESALLKNGSNGNGSYLGMGQLPRHVDPTAMLRSSYVEGKINLADICDPNTGTCIRYPSPAEVQKAIGAKIGGQSALHQGRVSVQLPAFYSHPTLGPWGVDPRAAYQYWWAQQAAMQQAVHQAPLAIWGSPGFVAQTQPLGPSTTAQTAAFNPYAQGFPTAGTAIERF